MDFTPSRSTVGLLRDSPKNGHPNFKAIRIGFNSIAENCREFGRFVAMNKSWSPKSQQLQNGSLRRTGENRLLRINKFVDFNIAVSNRSNQLEPTGTHLNQLGCEGMRYNRCLNTARPVAVGPASIVDRIAGYTDKRIPNRKAAATFRRPNIVLIESATLLARRLYFNQLHWTSTASAANYSAKTNTC